MSTITNVVIASKVPSPFRHHIDTSFGAHVSRSLSTARIKKTNPSARCIGTDREPLWLRRTGSSFWFSRALKSPISFADALKIPPRTVKYLYFTLILYF